MDGHSVALVTCALGLGWGVSWVYAARSLQVAPMRLVFVPILTGLRLAWAWGLVILAVLLAASGGNLWVVWVASLALALTGLTLVTRATRSYALSLFERGAERLRKRYGDG